MLWDGRSNRGLWLLIWQKMDSATRCYKQLVSKLLKFAVPAIHLLLWQRWSSFDTLQSWASCLTYDSCDFTSHQRLLLRWQNAVWQFFFKNKHRTPKILKEFEQFFPNLQILDVYPAHPEVPERNCSKSCHAPVFCKNTILLLVMDLMGYDRYPCKNWVLYCNPSIVLNRPVYLPPKWLSCIWFGDEKWWLLDEQKNEGFAHQCCAGLNLLRMKGLPRSRGVPTLFCNLNMTLSKNLGIRITTLHFTK